jgi:hypothetical protein
MKVLRNVIAATLLGVWFVVVAVSQPQNKPTQPITLVAGEWKVTYFVMGGGVASFGNCEATKIAVAPDNSIGLSLESLPCPHPTVKTWQFLLRPSADKKGYVLVVKSPYGPSADNLPVDYSPELGWRGKLPNSEKGLPQEAAVMPMKDGGWQVYAGSPEGTKLSDMPTPEIKVYLIPIKK